MLMRAMHRTIESSNSTVNILTPNEWVRELHINGTKAYEIGPTCDTCEFLFERNGTAPNRDFHSCVPHELRAGVTDLTDELTRAISTVMPVGDYNVGLHRVFPSLVTPNDPDDYFSNEQVTLWGLNRYYGLPNYPRTKYYRTLTKPLGNKSLFFEFIVPLFPPHWLDEDVVKEYQERLLGGDEPTALAISVLDIRSPEPDFGELPSDIDTHWCLAHYLLDGHNKVFAASQTDRPITLISYLSVDHSVASLEQIQRVLDVVLTVH